MIIIEAYINKEASADHAYANPEKDSYNYW